MTHVKYKCIVISLQLFPLRLKKKKLFKSLLQDRKFPPILILNALAVLFLFTCFRPMWKQSKYSGYLVWGKELKLSMTLVLALPFACNCLPTDITRLTTLSNRDLFHSLNSLNLLYFFTAFVTSGFMIY